MKITGYTIIFFLLGILLIYGFIQLEINIYNELWLSERKEKHKDFIIINAIILILTFFVLGITGCLDKLDKLLKKRLL